MAIRVNNQQKKTAPKGAVFTFNLKIAYLVITTRWTLLLPLLSYTLKK